MKERIFPLVFFIIILMFSLALQSVVQASNSSAGATKTPTLTPLPTWTPVTGVRIISIKADGKGDYKDLPEAINMAKENDVIMLDKGMYKLDEPLKISKGVTLLGSAMEKTIIVSKVADTGITYEGSGLLAVRGLTIRQEAPDHTMFSVKKGKFNFQSIKIEKTKNDCYFALYISGSAEGIIHNSVVTKNCAGIGINEKARVTLEENEIYQNSGTGVYVDEDAEGEIIFRKNIVKNNYQGISVNNDTVIIEDNDFLTNQRGIGFHNNTHSKALRNRLSTNLNGFVVFEDAEPIIEENLVFKNCWGMWMDQNATGTITKNQWNNNMIAIITEKNVKPSLKENQFNENGVGLLYSDNSGGTAINNSIIDTKTTAKFNVPGWRCWMDAAVGSGIIVSGEASPTLEENKVSGSAGSGILFKEKSSGVARKNELTNNQVGITVAALANPKLENNITRDNKKVDVDDIRVGAVLKPSPTPEPTADPISVVDETLADFQVDKKDVEANIKKWDVYQKPNNVTTEEGMVKLAGTDKPYQGFIDPDTFSGNKGVMFQYKRTGSGEITIGFDTGEWDTDSYKSYDVDPYANKFVAYVYKGKKVQNLSASTNKLTPKENIIYNLLMVVTENGSFLTKIWDPTHPEKIYTNYYKNSDTKWSGHTWTFRIRLENNKTTLSIRNFSEISFKEIKAK